MSHTFILRSVSEDNEKLRELSDESHQYDFKVGETWHTGMYYTIDFDSLHELMEFLHENSRAVVSPNLGGYQVSLDEVEGSERYDIDTETMDGEITLIDRQVSVFSSGDRKLL